MLSLLLRPSFHAFPLSLFPILFSTHLSQEQPGRTQVLVYADELVDLEGGHERQARERHASS